MAKQKLVDILLTTATTEGIKGYYSLPTATFGKKVESGISAITEGITNILIDYIKTSDYKCVSTKKGLKVSITNKQYKIIPIQTNYIISNLLKTSLKHNSPNSLEASLSIITPEILFIPSMTLDPINIYFKKTTGRYVFDHVSYAGFSYP